MLDIVILEAAQHVDDGVYLADIAQELVAKPFACAGAFHQPGNVHEGKLGVDHLRAVGDGGDLFQPSVGNGNLAHVGLDRAERVVGRLRGLRFGKSVEQGGLADVGQPHDPAAESHNFMPS